jgi:hypothetical protein
MKSTDSDKKGWDSPYKPSPKLPKQRPDDYTPPKESKKTQLWDWF